MKRTPPPRKPGEESIGALKTYLAEVIAVVWLAVVAGQYFSSYFLELDVSFRFAYVVILCLMIGAGIVSAVRRLVLGRK